MGNKPDNAGHEGEFLFCGKCGNRLSPAAVFCEMCGSPVHRAAQSAEAPVMRPLQQPAPPWQPPAQPLQQLAQPWQPQPLQQPVPAAPYAVAEPRSGMPRWLVITLGALTGAVLAGALIWLYIALI
jgi:hypothetical protein